MSEVKSIDREYFEANTGKMEYVRAPQPNEFTGLEIPEGARVRVYLINRRSLVKALEVPTGERLATIIEADTGIQRYKRAA